MARIKFGTEKYIPPQKEKRKKKNYNWIHFEEKKIALVNFLTEVIFSVMGANRKSFPCILSAEV